MEASRVFHKSVCIRLAALLLVITVAHSSAQLPNERPRPEPTFLTYATEGAGGYAGAMLGGTAGWFIAGLMYPWGGDAGIRMIAALGFFGAVLGCAGGTYGIGSAFRQDGRFLPTLGYTAVASVVGGGLCLAGIQSWGTPAGRTVRTVGAATLVIVPVIATIGYNRSRPRDSYGSRFVPGSVGLASVRDAEGIAHPALDVHLLTVRF
jgi:hypothetical protein